MNSPINVCNALLKVPVYNLRKIRTLQNVCTKYKMLQSNSPASQMMFLRFYYVTNANGNKESRKYEISTAREGQRAGEVALGTKVKEATKDAGYAGVIILGLAVTGIMGYAVFHELFSKRSPNVIYGNALKLIKADTRVTDITGLPIKGYGETTTRGRRRHVSFLEYEKDGINYMRMKFYVSGPNCKGTAHLELKENEKGYFDYRYLFVDLDGFHRRTIILKDDR